MKTLINSISMIVFVACFIALVGGAYGYAWYAVYLLYQKAHLVGIALGTLIAYITAYQLYKATK